MLLAELGVEPGPELRAAQRQVLGDAPADPSRPRAVPRQLTRAIPDFTGRADEVARVRCGR